VKKVFFFSGDGRMAPDFLHLSLSLSYVYNGCEIFHHFGHKFGQKRKRGWYKEHIRGARKPTDMSSFNTRNSW
jgi:hypothetical protein